MRIGGQHLLVWASQVAQWFKKKKKKPSANERDIRDAGSISGSRRSSRGWHGNPLQYSCLDNPMDRGAWKAIVHRVAKSRTRLKQLSMHTHLAV